MIPSRLVTGDFFHFIADQAALQGRADAVFAGLQENWLKLEGSAEFGLQELREAHRRLGSRLTTGKLALAPAC